MAGQNILTLGYIKGRTFYYLTAPNQRRLPDRATQGLDPGDRAKTS